MSDDELLESAPVANMTEYVTLKAEILKRIEMRQQFVSIILTLAAAFLGFGLSTEALAFVYPPLAMLLSLSWVQNDYQVRQLAAYIRDNHETPKTGLRWETYVHQKRHTPGASWRFVVLLHGGIFLLTQVLAVAIGLSNFTETTIEWILLAVDVVSILIVVRLFWRSR